MLRIRSIVDDDGHQHFGRPRTSQGPLAPIVPDDQNLPGWVPKNYIEKGEISLLVYNFQLTIPMGHRIWTFFYQNLSVTSSERLMQYLV